MTIRDHPDYPVRPGNPAYDRCECGGIRMWHAAPPRGCDHCDCEGFDLDEELTAAARVRFRARIVEPDDSPRPHREVVVHVGPQPGALAGSLTFRREEARQFVAMIAEHG